MTDITVSEIIKTFKNVKKKYIFSSGETDDFLTIIKSKKHWTFAEYKEFYFAYSLKYMHHKIMDSFAIYSIKKQYSFELSWNDYFKIIESITSPAKQKKYINFYFWHHSGMNEKTYQKLMTKPYFHFLSSKSKIKFLEHNLKTDNSNKWINNYFTDEEIKNSLKNNSLYIILDEYETKKFFGSYEKFMNQKTKVRFFHQVAKSGSLILIRFLALHIKKLNKIVLLSFVCSDMGPNNTLETLHCLREIGIRFNFNDLIKIQGTTRWAHIEYKQELIDFFKQLEIEKHYISLNSQLKLKNNKSNILIKI